MPDTVFNQSEIDEWRKEACPQSESLRVIRDYAKGDQGKPMTTAQQRALGRRGKHPVADNVLKLILRTTASRLELERFTVDDDAVRAYLEDFWVRNRLKALQYSVHFAMLRDGNHAISLRWKPEPSRTGEPAGGRVTVHREPWWDGKRGMFVAYGDYGEAVFAVKEWEERSGVHTTRRRTVYYPDMIQRLRLSGGAWEPVELDGDPAGSNGVVPWLSRTGRPLGVPVVHFANNLETDDDYGVSDLAGLIGLQDDLNAVQRDITAASAFTAFQMYLFTGVKPTDDLNVSPGQILELSDANANGKVLAAGDPKSLTNAHSYKRETMAVDTSTPIHVIAGGNWPSGVALLRSEMPLVSKVKALSAICDPNWTTGAHRATEIANTFGGLGLNEDMLIRTEWGDPEQLDELTKIEIDQARANLWASVALIRDRVILQKTGLLTDGEIDELLAAADEREADSLDALAQARAALELDDTGEF